jgi:hypothetical protein
MGPIILVALTAHHIPALQSNNSTSCMNLCLSADQLADILSNHMTITLLIISVKYVGNKPTAPLHTVSQNHLHNYTVTAMMPMDIFPKKTPSQSWLQPPGVSCKDLSITTKVMLILTSNPTRINIF